MCGKAGVKLVHGLGFNSGEYPAYILGKPTEEYDSWKSMLSRCSEAFWVKNPTYVGTTCSENFKSYSYFYKWYHQQQSKGARDVKGNKWCLDKDILVKGNKLYSEDTCVFVPQRINTLLINSGAIRGEFPVGVTLDKRGTKYTARCCGADGRKVLGYFNTAEEAFHAYKVFKENLIKQVANEYKDQLDPRAYNALMKYEVEITD